MSVAGTHKFLLEIRDLFSVKTLLKMEYIINNLLRGVLNRSRCQFMVILVKTTPLSIFFKIVGKEQHRTLK